MSLIEVSAATAIVLAGLYLLALGVVSLVVPARANRFLLGFASSKSVHFTELLLRCLVGAALIIYAPRMSFSGAFSLFGWVLLVTTVCLAFVPWRWHHRFAQQAVPHTTRHIALLGVASLAIGGLILAAVLSGSAV